MAGYLTSNGRRLALLGLIGAPGDLTLHLYINRVVVGPDTPLDQLMEAAYPGYSPVALAAKWDITNSTPMVAQYPQVRFSPTSDLPTPVTVFGYYLTRGSGQLIAVEAGGPFTLTLARDVITVDPTLVQT